MNEDLSSDQPDHETYFICIIASGFVSVVFPPHSFTYMDRKSGLERSFIVMDKSVKRLDCEVWIYKITARSKQAANITWMPNNMYRFTHCKLRLGTTPKTAILTKPILMCIYHHLCLLWNSSLLICENLLMFFILLLAAPDRGRLYMREILCFFPIFRLPIQNLFHGSLITKYIYNFFCLFIIFLCVCVRPCMRP